MKILLLGMFTVIVILLCALMYITGPQGGIPAEAAHRMIFGVKMGLCIMGLSFLLELEFIRKFLYKHGLLEKV